MKLLLRAITKEMSNLIEYKEGVLPEDNTNSSSDDAFYLEWRFIWNRNVS